MAASTIKEFLVKVGYKHDEVALRKITIGIEQATKSVIAFGAALTAVATTVAWGVSRIAADLEGLYFASKRTGESARHLEAFDLAAQRMGANAGEGIGAVEKLMQAFRTHAPGTWAAYLKGLFPGASINEQDPIATLLSIGEALRHMDAFQGTLRANKAGFDYNTLTWLKQSALGPTTGEMQKALGPNFEKAVEDAHRFENSLAMLKVRLEGFGATVVDVLEKKFGFSLDKISAWLDKNGAGLALSLANGVERILGFAERLWPHIEKLFGYLVKLNSATDGWSTVIIGLAVALPGLTSAVISLGAALAGLALGGPARGIALVAGLGYTLGTLFDKYTGVSTVYGGWAESFGEWFNNFRGKALFAVGGNSMKQAWVMDQLEKMGWSHNQAAGLVANAQYESGMNPNAENIDPVTGNAHRGLFQWSETRWADFIDMAKRQGWDTSDPIAQLKFMNQELRFGSERLAGSALLASQSASRAGYVVSHAYERPGSDVQDALRSGLAVQLANNTTIHVDGAQEPHRTADVIQQHMARLDSAIIREFASSVQ
jgi:hypothetical protein